MITALDHIVILAENLAAGTDRYAALGFAVERGGVHPGWGTENALVPLADGSYLELLAAHDPALAQHHRLWQRPDGATRAPGEYGGYFLGSDDLEHDVAVLRRRGLEWADPQEGSRKRPDGQIVRWRLAFPKRPDLPNLIQDLTPRPLRVAPPSGGGHDAPAPPGIHSVTLRVDGSTEGVGRIDPARTGGVRLDVRPA